MTSSALLSSCCPSSWPCPAARLWLWPCPAALAIALAALANANALGQNIANELSLVPRELLQYSSRALAFARPPIDSVISSVVPRNESPKINLRVN